MKTPLAVPPPLCEPIATAQPHKKRPCTKGGWLTPRMVAGYLRMHPRTLKQICNDDDEYKPPFFLTPTGHYYFDIKGLESWLELGEICPISNIRKSDFYTHAEAAEWLGISPRTLQKWRERKAGPHYYCFGQRLYRYHRQDLANWHNQRKSNAVPLSMVDLPRPDQGH